MPLFFIKNQVLHTLPTSETCKECYSGEHVTNHENIGGFTKCPNVLELELPPRGKNLIFPLVKIKNNLQ